MSLPTIGPFDDPGTPLTRREHPRDDDISWDSRHHTLGRGSTQAAPGNHKHTLSEIEGLEGGGGGEVPPTFDGYDRDQIYTTPASIAVGATDTIMLPLAAAFRLYRITTSAPCRVRMYTLSAKQVADASRPIGTDPVGDHGLIFEFVSTPSLLTADLSPMVDGFDGKTTPDGYVPLSVTNTGTVASAIRVTLIWIRTE